MNNKFLAIFFFMNLIKPVKRLLVRNVFVPFKKKIILQKILIEMIQCQKILTTIYKNDTKINI